ncbi:hypothetical protein PPL_08760 [Heterostelium album PN500]|uniref:Uncharacterized protein n=1 Tax=Heterostelium pallidum (strain ATCC 26659 / Pp 5 / PN500) TaxID=670386 RepID=D3BJN2_HETP5|nr:hypothetical protein PPL_08760 [Heterostelium album PN500]EFA78112.1 hypothetical protein PPL_08760 [Heterostelium album PN500]|eukprot:XP_020430238.1 hypothetical protein PPL_08760 [Heterostelium album PN500]
MEINNNNNNTINIRTLLSNVYIRSVIFEKIYEIHRTINSFPMKGSEFKRKSMLYDMLKCHRTDLFFEHINSVLHLLPSQNRVIQAAYTTCNYKVIRYLYEQRRDFTIQKTMGMVDLLYSHTRELAMNLDDDIFSYLLKMNSKASIAELASYIEGCIVSNRTERLEWLVHNFSKAPVQGTTLHRLNILSANTWSMILTIAIDTGDVKFVNSVLDITGLERFENYEYNKLNYFYKPTVYMLNLVTVRLPKMRISDSVIESTIVNEPFRDLECLKLMLDQNERAGITLNDQDILFMYTTKCVDVAILFYLFTRYKPIYKEMTHKIYVDGDIISLDIIKMIESFGYQLNTTQLLIVSAHNLFLEQRPKIEMEAVIQYLDLNHFDSIDYNAIIQAAYDNANIYFTMTDSPNPPNNSTLESVINSADSNLFKYLINQQGYTVSKTILWKAMEVRNWILTDFILDKLELRSHLDVMITAVRMENMNLVERLFNLNPAKSLVFVSNIRQIGSRDLVAFLLKHKPSALNLEILVPMVLELPDNLENYQLFETLLDYIMTNHPDPVSLLNKSPRMADSKFYLLLSKGLIGKKAIIDQAGGYGSINILLYKDTNEEEEEDKLSTPGDNIENDQENDDEDNQNDDDEDEDDEDEDNHQDNQYVDYYSHYAVEDL